MKEIGSYLRSKILKPGKWRSKVSIIDEPFRLVQKNWRNPSISSFGGGLKWGHGVKFMAKMLPRYIFLYRRLIWKMITNSKRKMPEFCYLLIVFHQKWFFYVFFIKIVWVSKHLFGSIGSKSGCLDTDSDLECIFLQYIQLAFCMSKICYPR